MGVISHEPWAEKSIPIVPGIRQPVIRAVRDKVTSGVYEPSNSSYRSAIFPVPKRDGTIRIVHNLQSLNRVSIKDAAIPPVTDQMAEAFGGASCYATLDLYVAFDQRRLDVSSRDLTTFSTPLGTFRLTVIPMGWTNSFQIMHGDITHILQDEIPDHTIPYADDVPIKGPKTRYELEGGGYETHLDNPGVWRFVWEHLNNVNCILHRVGTMGGMFLAKKFVLCIPSAEIVGHRCTYKGRVADPA